MQDVAGRGALDASGERAVGGKLSGNRGGVGACVDNSVRLARTRIDSLIVICQFAVARRVVAP